MPSTSVSVNFAAGSRMSRREVPSFSPRAVLLFCLMVFATSTIFVRQAWPQQCFQIGIFVLVAISLLKGLRGPREPLAAGVTPWFIYLIPFWGIVQILVHTTASTLQTREEVLKWASLAGVFFLTQTLARTAEQRRIILDAFLIFAAAMGVLCLTQMFTSGGKVFWLFDSGFPDVYATFPSHNNYAQFAEIALPIALWRSLTNGWRDWWYLLAGAIIFASVVGSSSRGGAALCVLELIVILFIGLFRLRRTKNRIRASAAVPVLVIVPLLAITFTIIVGWQEVWDRFKQADPYVVRREYIIAALDMTRRNPVIGHGLGTFPEVYQRYAIRDFPFYANHAHCDWAEFAADGGIPFALFFIMPFFAIIPTAFRHPWGLGLVAIMIHALIDFPFPRPAVSAWLFMMLALLYMARTTEIEQEEAAAVRSR